MNGRLLLAAVMTACAAIAPSARAQTVASGTIHGAVRDEQGGTLPGVTVMLASPALQVGQLVTVTDVIGGYSFPNLPAGTYSAKFDLEGFSRVIREELRLTVGFVAQVDVQMKVGGLEESVTVSGKSPVVDTTQTGASVTLTKEALAANPKLEVEGINITINVLNLRVGRQFALKGTSRFQIDLNVYNLLNSGASTAVSYLSGPAFGYATSVLPPRVARLGAKFSF